MEQTVNSALQILHWKAKKVLMDSALFISFAALENYLHKRPLYLLLLLKHKSLLN
eukprot:c15508_g1_i2 orf=2-163(-)